MHTTLATILILLGASVVVVVVCRLVRLPAILGYLVVGILVGPHALRWVEDTPITHSMGEFGIVFLMFSLGLEFSLAHLKAMRSAVFGLGTAQVAITVLAALVALPLAGFSWQASLVLGGALAMSSTAIVTKMLAERMELATPHGRDIIAILLFQDLAVVAFIVMIPALGGDVENLTWALVFAAIKGAIALTLILGLGQRPMRAWFSIVARQRSSELFILNVLLVTIGLATLTEFAGLSLALGAFLTGMLISETEFKLEVEEDIKPFRDVLLGVFFVTVGMALDLGIVAQRWHYVLLLLTIAIGFKLVSIAAIARAFGAPLASSLRTGFFLAQVGELALVMLTLARDNAILEPALAQVVLASMVLSMLCAPLIIQFAEPIVRKLTANDWLARAAQVTSIASTAMVRQQHVLVCGYGRSGQNLARLLEREDIAYVALDNDPARVKEAAAGGSSVVYGDAVRRESLLAAGLAKAKVLVITFADTRSALKILHHAKQLRPDLPVLVRTIDESDLELLMKSGATTVVPEVLEGSLMLASHSLLVLGVPIDRVLARIRSVREERYSLFRGFFRGETDPAYAAGDLQPRLHSVMLPHHAAAVGRSREELALEGLVDITGVRRQGTPLERPGPDFRFEVGDVLVLLGAPQALSIAEARLLQG